MRILPYLCAVMIVSTPVMAFDIEEIGQLAATFNGEDISQPTVLARDGDLAQGTAFLHSPGGGFTLLSLSGYSADNKRLAVEIDFMSPDPGPQTAPLGLTITYSPTGSSKRWTSDGAPTEPAITFTTLEAGAEEGRAVGSFTALLCYSEDYEDDGAPDNCHPIEGNFDTRFFIE